MRILTTGVCFVALGLSVSQSSLAQDEADLAMQLANPVASLISVPIQANYNDNFGLQDEGSMLRINVQPVIPFDIGEDWNLISRTILPIIDQSNIPTAGFSETGLGDTA